MDGHWFKPRVSTKVSLWAMRRHSTLTVVIMMWPTLGKSTCDQNEMEKKQNDCTSAIKTQSPSKAVMETVIK